MPRFERRDALKALGARALALGGVTSLRPPEAVAAEACYPIERGAELKLLRWQRFVPGDEDPWMANTRKVTAQTGVPVLVESVNGEDIRPEGAMAPSVGAAPDIIMGAPDMPRLYPEKCVDLTTVADYLGQTGCRGTVGAASAASAADASADGCRGCVRDRRRRKKRLPAQDSGKTLLKA